jgi:hypothetical protein
MGDSIRVNGNQLSWGSIRLKVRGEEYTGFTGVSFSDKRERVKAYGMGKHHAPRGRSRGKYTIENVKLTGWKSSISRLRDALAQGSTNGQYGDVEFQIVVMYSEPDEDSVVIEINGCVWAANSTSDEESPDPLKEEIELDAMYIKRNGMVLYDNSEGAPQ